MLPETIPPALATALVAKGYNELTPVQLSMLGEEADSLLIIECLPSLETRNYVEKVMAAYWTYKKKFGEEPKSLDALAKGAKFVDARNQRYLPLASHAGAVASASPSVSWCRVPDCTSYAKMARYSERRRRG